MKAKELFSLERMAHCTLFHSSSRSGMVYHTNSVSTEVHITRRLMYVLLGKASSFVFTDEFTDQLRRPKLKMIFSTTPMSLSNLEANGALGKLRLSTL